VRDSIGGGSKFGVAFEMEQVRESASVSSLVNDPGLDMPVIIQVAEFSLLLRASERRDRAPPTP
jgi:hypothetical protein